MNDIATIPHNNRLPIVIDRATPIYRAFMLELERQRIAIGLSMDEVSDRAGIADRSYGKCLYADRPSGRAARWETVQDIVDALFVEGFDLILKPKAGARLGPDDLRRKVLFAASETHTRTRRQVMSELGKLGAAARAKKLTSARKLKIAKKSFASRCRQTSRTRCCISPIGTRPLAHCARVESAEEMPDRIITLNADGSPIEVITVPATENAYAYASAIVHRRRKQGTPDIIFQVEFDGIIKILTSDEVITFSMLINGKS